MDTLRQTSPNHRQKKRTSNTLLDESGGILFAISLACHTCDSPSTSSASLDNAIVVAAVLETAGDEFVLNLIAGTRRSVLILINARVMDDEWFGWLALDKARQALTRAGELICMRACIFAPSCNVLEGSFSPSTLRHSAAECVFICISLCLGWRDVDRNNKRTDVGEIDC